MTFMHLCNHFSFLAPEKEETQQFSTSTSMCIVILGDGQPTISNMLMGFAATHQCVALSNYNL